MQGLGFSIPLTPKKRMDHILSVRAEGFPMFTIKTAGQREEYSSIIFL
ncbi:MAG TPA: hypothetical protein DEA75_04255 [Rhodobacteraceae bacterium]|nr:hypothetical protein [Paracoccaceae bacterium]